MLGDADGIAARRVHDQNAAAGGGVEIDVVHTDAGAADDAEPRGGAEERVGNASGAADDERIGIGQGGCQRGRTGQDDFPAGLA